MGKNNKKTDINSIGKIIKQAREEKGLMITDLAWKINNPKVTEITVKAWETGKQFPDLDMMYKLSEILELNPNELLQIRNNIQEESFSKTNTAARHLGGRMLSVSKPVIKIVFELVLGASVIYLAANYKAFENRIAGENDPEQINFISEKIQEQIDIYVGNDVEDENIVN